MAAQKVAEGKVRDAEKKVQEIEGIVSDLLREIDELKFASSFLEKEKQEAKNSIQGIVEEAVAGYMFN